MSALQDERQKLAARMTPKAARLLLDLPLLRVRRLEEMRFYAGQNACFIFDGRSETQHAFFSRQDVDELVTALCGYSRYAYETQLAQGFIPLEGGCHAGVCGRVTRDNDGAARLSSPTSVCIRMAREISGASEAVFPFLMEERRVCRVLLLGPPGCGKTTVLRDAAKRLAGDGIRVSVCDEREELFPEDAAQAGLDVMRGIDKPTAIQMLLRAMSPQAIFCDEIGDMRDVRALLDAARCGVGLAASAHAGVFDDVLHRPVLRALYEAGAFERYLLLGRHGKLAAAYDAEGKPISGGGIEHEKRRGDGHDFAQRDRLCGGGRRNAPCPLGAGHAPNPDADKRHDSL